MAVPQYFIDLIVIFRFSTVVVESAIECWQWLLSSRPGLQLAFMVSMANAWQETVLRKLGIFTPDQDEGDPLAVSEDHVPHPAPPYSQPHRIWIQVRSQMSYFCKKC